MYNLLIAIAIALVAYGIGAAVAGWIAGFVPALFALTIAYFLLMRRTGKQLEAVMAQATDAFEKGKIERGRKILEAAFPLAKWQFLIGEQIHAQLGAIDYLQRRFGSARKHLEQAWSRNWMSQAMLACVEFREGNKDKALAVMESATGPGGKDPTFWALYAWLAHENGDKDKALAVLTEGLKKNEGSTGLKNLADLIRNKKRIKPDKAFSAFAPGWYQFWPEHMPRSQMMAQAGMKPGGYSYPQPRGFRRS